MMVPKAVMITGANRGLGLEFIKQFMNLTERPKLIIATCRNPEGAEDLSKLKNTDRCTLKVIKADFSFKSCIDYAALKKEVENSLTENGLSNLNLLINNAGVLHKNTSLDILNDETSTILSDLQEAFHVNVVSPFALTMALKSLLVNKSDDKSLNWSTSCVIMMSSTMGSIGENNSGGAYAYKTTKAALNALMRTSSFDLKKDGILTFALHPGWVRTEMGGPNGLLSIEEGVDALMKLFPSVNEKHHGQFIRSSGASVGW